MFECVPKITLLPGKKKEKNYLKYDKFYKLPGFYRH